jgi:hypothetical protein
VVGGVGYRDVAVFAVAVLVVLFLVRAEIRQSRILREGGEAHNYLCYQKTVTIPQRVATAKAYIEDLRVGKRPPLPGITIADIQLGIDRDEAVLRALTRVNC